MGRDTFREEFTERSGAKPAAQENGPRWTPARLCVANIIMSFRFDILVAGAIMSNFFLLIIEADAEAIDQSAPVWVEVLNTTLMTLYIVEVCARLFVYQQWFCSESWNILDICVVALDLGMLIFKKASGNIAPSFVILRLCRVARCMRILKLVSLCPEVGTYIQGMIFAARAIFWGVLLIIGILAIWSIVAVQIIHPLNKRVAIETSSYEGCARCEFAFSSVAMAMATIFQTSVAGDSWGQVALPIMEHYPGTILFFVPCFISISLTIMNLILAVIVDSAMKLEQKSIEEQGMQKHKEMERAIQAFTEICRQIDADGSGLLSRDELHKGFDDVGDFQGLLHLLGLRREDLDAIFDVMDEDASGDIKYVEFADSMHRISSSSMQVLFFENYKTRVKVQDHFRYHRQSEVVPVPGMNAMSTAVSTCSVPGMTAIDVKAMSEAGKALVVGKDQYSRPEMVRLIEANNDVMTAVLDVGRRVQAQEQMLEAHSHVLTDLGEALPVLLGRGAGPKRYLSQQKLGEVPSQWRGGTQLPQLPMATKVEDTPCCCLPGGYSNPVKYEPVKDWPLDIRASQSSILHADSQAERTPSRSILKESKVREEKAGWTEAGHVRPVSWPAVPAGPPMGP